MNNAHSHYYSIILSAGLSSRMKQPKLLLAWQEKTVIGKVIDEFKLAGVEHILLITGGHKELVEKEAFKYGVNSIFNPHYENGEMINSIQAGLSYYLNSPAEYVFIALGDQPGVHHFDISQMIALRHKSKAKLIIPSYQMRRGHPWLVDRSLWPDLFQLSPPKTMREFIEENKKEIQYYLVQKSNILDDLDTPEDYERIRPR